ncbi:MAG: DNA polymerase III subunit epsilon [Gammaproteobacteria bacterium]|mgnify:FL=1|jgi:DNA polymerase-3 subunit epsilon|nr:DNA polymerase III subunit epsilon [Gammaproteobacteria bacterium]|tara:strand:- start:1141 stop:1863 length:723 start_codon:yes stop_codon:yes gene_type:complete
MRQVVLDTETTGLEVEAGHRILEIGCVEIVGRKLTRRHYHQYINPERESDDGALEVHGITSQFLADKPVFADVWENFLQFVNGSELIIHNAAFDIGFLNREMRLHDRSLGKLTDYCSVVDSLALARNKHPGQKNNLNALCKRYSVDNSQRQLHGALLDAEILADVYLLLTGGQVTLGLEEEVNNQKGLNSRVELDPNRPRLNVIKADEQELTAHENKLDYLDGKSEVGAVWRSNTKGETG